jgi:hypothetical protein
MTNTAYCVSFGQGTYQTTATASGTWSLLSGGPEYCESAVVANGIYYCAGGTDSGISGGGQNTTLVKYQSGSFTTIRTDSGGPFFNSVHAVVVNPNDSTNIVYARGDGSIVQSADSGATWTHSYTVGTLTANDVPWLSETGAFLSAGCLLFDQLTAHKLWLTAGAAIWTVTALTSSTSPATGTAIGYSSVSAGIENMIAQKIISMPGGGLIDACLDFQVRYHTSPTAYPTTYGIIDQGTIYGCFDIDVAKDGSGYCVAYITNTSAGNISGYSTNGGQTWSVFPNTPSGSNPGGMIAMANSSSVVSWSGGNTHLQYLTSLTGSWASSTGMPTSGWPFFEYGTLGHYLCADAAQNYYFQLDGQGLYKSTNGGASFSLIDSTNLSAVFQGTLLPVPGIAQFLCFTSGKLAVTHPSTQLFYYRTSDGGGWSSFANVADVWSCGCGAAAPGFSNPTLWIFGFVNGVYGLWVSKNATTTPASATWTMLTTYPFGNPDWPVGVTGDYSDHTKCYITFSASNFGYGENLSY